MALTSPIENPLTNMGAYGTLKFRFSDGGHPMTRSNINVGKRGFISGLAKDESGNVLMIMAAAIIPLLAITGGAIDTSRAYMVKERLQAACDAGVLAGRKAMTTNAYTTGAATRAAQMFNYNYEPGMLGTNSISFGAVNVTEILPGTSVATNTGEIKGTASANMPTVLMSMFGKKNLQMNVECSSDLQVPNLDIMMVVDVTGSMKWCPDGTSVTAANIDKPLQCPKVGGGFQATRIVALRSAMKNFYTKIQTATAASSKTIVRYGFVPYAGAVNGKDLTDSTNSLFANSPSGFQLGTDKLTSNFAYESRAANFNTPKIGYAIEPEKTVVSYETYVKGADPITSSTVSSSPPSGGTIISYNDCTGISNPVQGYAKNLTFSIDDGTNSGTVFTPNPSGQPLYKVGATTSNSVPGSSVNEYQKITYESYTYDNQWSAGIANLEAQYRACTRKKTVETYKKKTVGYGFTNWVYKPVSYDVSGYKAGNALQYVSSFDTDDAYTVVAGEYSPQQLLTALNAGSFDTSSVTWSGCTEEPDTVAVATFKPEIPTGALDLQYNNTPNSDNARWRPMLGNLLYSRPSTATVTDTAYSRTASNLFESKGITRESIECPSASMRNLNEIGQTAYNSYVDGLQPDGGTYHDIGMVWGLRLLSKNGMFSARNLVASNGAQIDRNIIFLTDGELDPSDYYVAWGSEKTSRRVIGNITTPDEAELHARRFQALCDAAKFDESVTVSIIAFGTALTDNLKNCASDGRAYYADDTAKLDAAFERIAKSIADLRLTK